MVAVLTVFACHLTGWPHGGFVGVDVFFVVSGFLITGILLRTADTTGTISFRGFYTKRVRRIVPAATVTLIAIVGAALLIFVPFRAHQVMTDAIWAFCFGANWHYAFQGTDYFTAGEAVSPVRHYWSLSIEEQFYFVWPALIFLIGVLVIRRSWPHSRRMAMAGFVMAFIVASSLAYSVYKTAANPTWAYFDTFARVWELGVGAILATAVGVLARIPSVLRPVLSWTGIGLITLSLFIISEGSPYFPAPWAVLPVTGAALVVAAGVGCEPKYQQFLRNPVSTYIGDISYSLYLIHWPVIVFTEALMDRTPYFYVTVVALTFGLSVASYQFIENPCRQANLDAFRDVWRQRTTQIAGVAVAALIITSMAGFLMRPEAYRQPTAPPPIPTATSDELNDKLEGGPAATALQAEIVEALKATAWPQLNPTLDEVVRQGMEASEVAPCHRDSPAADLDRCTWGSPTAPVRVVLAGDSVAVGYAGVLRQIALDSGGQIQVISEAMSACAFAHDLIERPAMTANCPVRKQSTVDLINSIKPNVVIISNRSRDLRLAGSRETLKPQDWSNSLRQIVEEFRASTGKVVFLSPPPSDIDIQECFSKRNNLPADCVAPVGKEWYDVAMAERRLAESINGAWIDTRPWFCRGRVCPAFVGSNITKFDWIHMAPSYGTKILPVIKESFTAAGIF